MKQGLDFERLCGQIMDDANSRSDYMVTANTMRMELGGDLDLSEPNPHDLELVIPEIGRLDIGETFHNQMSSKLQIPLRYYNRMLLENPDLLTWNVNHWLSESNTKNMVRTMDGKARAFLSDRYRPIDNDMVGMAVLPMLDEKGADIVSSNISESRMNISAITTKFEGVIKPGDNVCGGIHISNSEIGLGSFKIQLFIWRVICSNGMYLPLMVGSKMRKFHIGSKYELNGAGELYITNETMQADNRLLMLQMRDMVNAAFDPDVWEAELANMRTAADREIPANHLETAVDVVTERFALNQSERNAFFENLIGDKDYSVWGLANALTELGNHDNIGYDRATELQNIGGRILTDTEVILAEAARTVEATQ